MILTNRRRRSVDIWPGFVDALAALVMVVMFVLLLFSVGQFLLSDALVGRDEALQRLRNQITGLADVLAMERKEKAALQTRLTALSGELEATVKARDAFEARLSAMTMEAQESATQLEQTQGELQLARNTLSENETTLQQQREMIAGLEAEFEGSIGSAAFKMRDLNVARTGLTAASAALYPIWARMASEQENRGLISNNRGPLGVFLN